jgi:hypothetical protein
MKTRAIPLLLATPLLITMGCHVRVGVTGSDAAVIDDIASDRPIDTASSSQDSTIFNQGSGRSVSDGNVDFDKKYTVSIASGSFGKFMATYRDEIERSVSSAGGKIHGRGRTGSENDLVGFALDYSRGSRDGVVKVFSAENISDSFTVIVVCYEHD